MGIVEIKGISKNYGSTKALDDVNLKLEPNRIYGLLGRNGAGKTTLLNLMTNKLFPTKGEITLDGESVYENDLVLNKIFYMMERNLYPEGMKVKEVFKWTKSFYRTFDEEYADTLAERFELNVNKKIKGLSTGYTSIFKAIVALATNAEVMIFDEPVLGLDAHHRNLLYKEILSNYIEKPKTIVISTHLIEEISDLIEQVIIIKKGKIVLNQSVEELLSSAYTVSGEESKVEEYITSKSYVGLETIGKFKSATVLEPVSSNDRGLAKELNLEITKAELQKLFISLTSA